MMKDCWINTTINDGMKFLMILRVHAKKESKEGQQ